MSTTTATAIAHLESALAGKEHLAAVATTPRPGIRKLNLSQTAAKKPEKSATVYPELRDPSPDRPGEIAQLAEAILRDAAELETLTGSDGKGGSLGLAKAELRAIAIPQYFSLMQGKGEIPSSLAARTADGREVLVTLSSKYKTLDDEAPLLPYLGEHADRLLRQKISFKVDADLIPEDKLGDVYEELVGLFKRHACEAALTHTQCMVPTEDFHTLRHSLFNPETNLAIDRIMPIQAMVKTKGRKTK